MATYRQENEHDDVEWPPEDFTGEWIVEWPNGQVKVRSLYLGGKEEGVWLCYWPNGQIAQRGYNSYGEAAGVWFDYREDGTKMKETEFRKARDFQVRFYWPGGDLKSSADWVDGRCVREEAFPPPARF